jgi:tRNA(adenine34) deaminase
VIHDPKSSDIAYLARTLELAKAAANEHGEVPVGALLILGDLLVETKNEKEARPDPTAHAEILALREAAARLGVWRLSGATVYVSKEPCIMCAGALVAARVTRVVFGAYDPKGGAAGSVLNVFTGPGINHYVEVVGGVLEEEAGMLLKNFFRQRRRAMDERNNINVIL